MSFTTDWKNLKGNADVVVEFTSVYGATQIKYTKDWFMKHPNIARYVLSEDAPTPAPPLVEVAELATQYKFEQEWVAKSPTPLPYIKSVQVLNRWSKSRVRELLPDITD